MVPMMPLLVTATIDDWKNVVVTTGSREVTATVRTMGTARRRGDKLVIFSYDWPMMLLPVLVDGDGDGVVCVRVVRGSSTPIIPCRGNTVDSSKDVWYV
jgi:hypothetical protein